ncbi:tRNA pseudouridine synthase A [Campylobacter insulaenigrae]|nr:tRNA pseudouridine synthase A [Campylobacter insulaenigrae]
MLVKLTFSYDGSKFQGSASQPHKNTVQDKLAQVLGHLGIYEKILFASRTDKGVHATNAVASVEIDEYFRDFVYLKTKLIILHILIYMLKIFNKYHKLFKFVLM